MVEERDSGAGLADKRRHARYEITAYVDYTGSEVLLYHRIENISLGGICIQSTSLEPLGTVVDLVLNFPDLDASVALQGEVVWANAEEPMDMGVRFLEVDTERREILRRHISAVRERRSAAGVG